MPADDEADVSAESASAEDISAELEGSENNIEAKSDDEPLILSEDVTDDVIEDAEIVEDEVSAADESTETEIETQIAAPAPVVERTGPGAGSLVFGGVVAGAIGFGAAMLGQQNDWFNTGTSDTSETSALIEAQSEKINAQDELIASQSAEIDAISKELDQALVQIEGISGTSDLSSEMTSVRSDVDGLTQDVAALNAKIDTLSGQLEEIIARPAVLSPDGEAEMQEQLKAFQTELETAAAAAKAEIEAAEQRASEIEQAALAEAKAAARRAAIADVKTALENGTPFAEPLGELEGPPEALASVADSGVTTLGALQEEFPVLARTALGEAQELPENASTGDRVTAFLRRHTNARSLSPKDGDDVDAILSRAEAALGQGEIGAAIAEIETLPPESMNVFSSWVNSAQKREQAVSALSALAASAQ
ncbi:MAG: hypothetical protein OXQ92_02540 [Boseongicola sp.]|nr:hypothetical protein [Boseongicola sp.]MDD9979357.1 hypothetical protein [Boseongicola sp.]